MSAALLAERYELVRPLGQGGGGEVWAACDQATGQLVALKLLSGRAGSAEVDALIRETTALSGLEGLGFPRVLELGRTSEGRLFLVRELVEGESLEAVAEREPERALSLLGRVADVLTVVHRSGMLHGDVKPANIIVHRSGEVALVDLGLATVFREGGEAAVGLTPHFAAPEIWAGGPLTAQAEVFSLGVMLADLLARPEVLAEQPGRRTELGRVAAHAGAHEPHLRYPSADEFALAVDGALGLGRARPSAAPWPVLGVDGWAHQLRRSIEQLEPAGVLRVEGPPGAGSSTLLRRVCWGLALEGRPVVLVDAAVAASGVFERVLGHALVPQGVVFWDDVHLPPPEVRERIRRSNARLIQISEGSDAAARFVVPALDETQVRTLLRGALPGLPSTLIAEVVRQVGARPRALRQWVAAAQHEPLVNAADVAAVLAEVEVSALGAAAWVERRLDRGHFGRAKSRLDELDSSEPEGAWLRARYEIAAGSAEVAQGLLEQALARPMASELRPRLVVTLGRALLGRGSYERALEILAEVEQFETAVRAEGFAFRGLCLTLLGQPQEALPLLRAAEALAVESNSARLRALTATSLATAEWRLADLSAATLSYERAIAAAGEAGDSGTLASAQINLAGLKKERGDLAASIELLEAAEDAARRAGRNVSVQQALLNLTNADLYLGRFERARAELLRLGSAEELPAALRAQFFGLRAELLARSFEYEQALAEFDRCAAAFEELGRGRDASEAWLESALLLVPEEGHGPEGEPQGFRASEELLARRVERGRQLLDGEVTPLLRLSEARLLAFRNEGERAEQVAREARSLADSLGQREWAWRALALEAELLDSAGKRTRAARARAEAVEILEEIGARLPPDLREVYWSDPRRRALRVRPVSTAPAPHKRAPVPRRELGQGTGTDAISRLTQTHLERRLARILAINNDLAGEIDLNRLATKIVGHAAELLGAERGYLLLGSSPASLRICASRSAQGAEHQEFSRSIAREVLATGKPLVSIDAARDQRLRAFESVHAALIEAVACVPILSPLGSVVGALYLETRVASRNDFADELPTLQAFADQAAIALENARLLAELAEKGQTLEHQNRQLSEAQERLKELLGRRTARLREVRQELRSTRDKLAVSAGFRGLVGTSSAMRRIYALIERVQETDVPVLITGESGTGKEVVARAIHEGSARRARPLLAVNCGAIPESILESELFGHKRGAFTGAERDRKGLFQDASTGTLFLDEIGETPLKMQAGLLRVLQEQRVRPVGGSEEIPVDVRVIFATNRNLQNAVELGTFREDLLYRIQVVEIALPPLRERPEDIPLLVDHFLGRLAVRFSQEKKTLSREALGRLCQHPLPGNVRQLENTLLNAWVLCEGNELGASDINLPRSSSESVAPPARLASEGRTVRPSTPPESSPDRNVWNEHQLGERQQIIEALQRTGWNRVRAAEVLDMPRRTLYRRLREYGIQ